MSRGPNRSSKAMNPEMGSNFEINFQAPLVNSADASVEYRESQNFKNEFLNLDLKMPFNLRKILRLIKLHTRRNLLED